MRLSLNLHFLILALFFFSSCASVDTINDDFNEQYGGKKLEALKAQRRSTLEKQSVQGFFTQPTSAETNVINPNNQYQDIVKFGQNNFSPSLFRGENYYPDANSQISPKVNIFDLDYQLAIHQGFRRSGIEFDNITIPKADAYGIESAMSDKSYFLPGGNLLKNSIDEAIATKEDFDDQNSEILAKEKQQILRKDLMKKIFGNYQEIGESKEEKAKESKQKKRKSKQDNQVSPDKKPINSGFTIKAIR